MFLPSKVRQRATRLSHLPTVPLTYADAAWTTLQPPLSTTIELAAATLRLGLPGLRFAFWEAMKILLWLGQPGNQPI